MKKLLALVLALVMALALAACGSGDASTSETSTSGSETEGEGEAWVGGYACHSANDFFDAIESGLQQAAAETNGTIIRADSELAMSSEIAIIENFITQGVDVIFLTPNDPAGSIEGVTLANEAGIPVVVISSELDEGDYADKLTEILRRNDIKSVTVVRMEVPCCGGLENAVKRALQNCGKLIPWQVTVISTDGRILDL